MLVDWGHYILCTCAIRLLLAGSTTLGWLGVQISLRPRLWEIERPLHDHPAISSESWEIHSISAWNGELPSVQDLLSRRSTIDLDYGRGRCYHSKIWGDIHHMGEKWFCQKAGCILYVLHVNVVNDEKSLDFWGTLFLHKPVTGEHPPQSPSPKSRSRNAKWCQPQYLFHTKMLQWRQELRVNHRTTYSIFTCIALYTSINK